MTRRSLRPCLALLLALSACGGDRAEVQGCRLEVELERGFIRAWGGHSWTAMGGSEGDSGGGSFLNNSSLNGEGAILLLGVVVVIVVIGSVVSLTRHISRGAEVTLLITGEGHRESHRLLWGQNRLMVAEEVLANIEAGTYALSVSASGTYHLLVGIPLESTKGQRLSTIVFADDGSTWINDRRVGAESDPAGGHR